MRPITELREPLTRLWSSALTVRILNILHEMQVEYIEQLENISSDNLLDKRGFGGQCLITLEAALEELDVQLEDKARKELTSPEDPTFDRNKVIEEGVYRHIPAQKLRMLVTAVERAIDCNPKIYPNVQIDMIKAAVYDARNILSQPIERDEEA